MQVPAVLVQNAPRDNRTNKTERGPEYCSNRHNVRHRAYSTASNRGWLWDTLYTAPTLGHYCSTAHPTRSTAHPTCAVLHTHAEKYLYY
jgi:hypothetical protein